MPPGFGACSSELHEIQTRPRFLTWGTVRGTVISVNRYFPAVSHFLRFMSEPPPVDAASDAPSGLSSRSVLTGTAFFLVGGILAILGDLGLASLSALVGTGVMLLVFASDHRPHVARLGIACTALGGVASIVHVLLRVLGP